MLAVYGGALFGVMFVIHGADGLAKLAEAPDPLKGQVISFISLTVPFALYFAILESRPRPDLQFRVAR